jgi:hypothetical protein
LTFGIVRGQPGAGGQSWQGMLSGCKKRGADGLPFFHAPDLGVFLVGARLQPRQESFLGTTTMPDSVTV